MKRQPIMTRHLLAAREQGNIMIHVDNEERKVHEKAPFALHRRMRSFLKSKDTIIVIAGGFLVLSAFLLGKFTASTQMECGTKWSFTENDGMHHFPRLIRLLINESGQGMQVRKLDLTMDIYPSKRIILVTPKALKHQEYLLNSKDYKHRRADVFETAECKAQYPWQLMQFPTCNTVFEYDLTSVYTEEQSSNMSATLIANGFWRDVWIVKDFSSNKRILKTLRYEHEYTGGNYDRHRRDALAMERMTKSPHVLDIYGYCGNSGLFQYASGGDIIDKVWPRDEDHINLTMLEKLQIATQVAMAVATVHNVDKEGQASIAHTDITPSQFISVDGVFKLNDFNRARFIRWSVELNEPCGYYVGKNPGKSRSPEEYNHDEQSEMVDIYSMGNIFYMLLTGLWPFENVEEKVAQQLVMKGIRPEFPPDVLRMNDSISQTLREALNVCQKQNSTERASARQVENILKGKLLELDGNALLEWGFEH